MTQWMPEHFLASTEHQCKKYECRNRICLEMTYLNFVLKIFAFFGLTTEIFSKYLHKLY